MRMPAQEYARTNDIPLEKVVGQIREGYLNGYQEGNEWFVAKSPRPAGPEPRPYEKNGAGLLDVLAIALLLSGAAGTIVFALIGSLLLAVISFLQGVVLFALFRGFASNLRLLSFICRQLDKG